MWGSLRLAAFSFALANLFHSALSVPIQKPLKCNGHQELCERSYGNTTFLGSHDSFSISTNPWILARNQEIPLMKQLSSGVRMLQVQAHMNGDAIHLCHTACFLFDGNTFETYLKQVKSFLDKNPDEVITIVIANPGEIPPSAFKKIFEKSGVANIAYSPPQLLMKRDDWPTLGEMITAGKRVVIFMDKGFPAPPPPPPAPAPPSSSSKPATTVAPPPASSSKPATTVVPPPASSSKPATTTAPAPASSASPATSAASSACPSKTATSVSSRTTTTTTVSVQVKLSARPDGDSDDGDDLDPRSDGDDDSDSDVNTEYIIPQFPVMWEDPYDPQDLEFSCRVDRTQGPLKPNQQLNLINHNLNMNFIPLGHGLRIPNRWWASVTNKASSIIDHAGNCTQFTDGKNPNFVLLDWVNVGQGARAVDMLNGFR